jgi:hypothetical protein
VNDVLNYYIQVTDTKASIFILLPLDEEYSVLTFYTAQILEKKICILRVSIRCFLTGVLTARPHHLLNA